MVEIDAHGESVSVPALPISAAANPPQVTIWVFLILNCAFLAGRLFLRLRRPKNPPPPLAKPAVPAASPARLKLSDYLLVASLALLFAQTLILTVSNTAELQFRRRNPDFPTDADPLVYNQDPEPGAPYVRVSVKDFARRMKARPPPPRRRLWRTR